MLLILEPARANGKLWSLAREHELVILTKDADFSERIAVGSPPPWVVHLRIGNIRSAAFHQFLKQNWNRIFGFLPQHKLVNVYWDRIEALA